MACDKGRPASCSPQPSEHPILGTAPSLPLQQVHILPLAETDQKLGGWNRLDFVAPEIRRRRSCQEIVKKGDLIRNGSLEFAVVKCRPPEGTLGVNTRYYVEGSPVVRFEKIQFSAWGPEEMSPHALFSDCIAGYFEGEYAPYGSPGAKSVRLFYPEQTFWIGDVHVEVQGTEPSGLGVVTKDTEIFANWDRTPEFEKVHVVPFQETLPQSYQFDVFQDYLQPYLRANAHSKFSSGDIFTYHAVKFQVVCCEPDECARIGHNTTIFCEGALCQLTPLGQFQRTTLARRHGRVDETLAQVEKFVWPPSSPESVPPEQRCMVCLGSLETSDECCRLHCCHVFHSCCLEQWFRFCTDCPLCRSNVDGALCHD